MTNINKMKKLFLTTISISFMVINTIAQQTPVFVGRTYVDNGGMGRDEIDKWKYKGYVFITSTPGVARPITTTSVYKYSNNELTMIRNSELFGKNNTKIIELVNSKLKSEFSLQKMENSNCYKEFYPLGINELSISIDKMYMYFEIIWEDSYVSNIYSECYNPSTIAKIKLSEISSFIVMPNN